MLSSMFEVIGTLFGARRCLSVRDTESTMFVEMLLECKGKLNECWEFFWAEMLSSVSKMEKILFGARRCFNVRDPESTVFVETKLGCEGN
jgi:hypothetical protein